MPPLPPIMQEHPVATRQSDAFLSLAQHSLTRDSAFAYRCHRCTRCCSQYRIPVGPFDLLLLAKELELSTTDVIRRHIVDGLYLRRQDDGACAFLNERGCSVHGGRPLVCRIYPLAHSVTQGQESFGAMEPVSGSAGQWGRTDTVRGYLEQQGAIAAIEGVDFYLDLHAQLQRRLEDAPLDQYVELGAGWSELGGTGIAALGMLDPDAAIERYCNGHHLPRPQEMMDKARCHARALHEWMDEQLEQLT